MAYSRQLVLGLGNPLAGDDGFGRAVVEALGQRPGLLGGVDVRDAGTDLLGEVDSFETYQHVVLVDAVVGAGPAGRVAAFEEAVFSTWPATSTGCHGVAPLVALELFRTLYPDATTRFTLVALQSAGIRLGPGLAAGAVARGVELVARALHDDQTRR